MFVCDEYCFCCSLSAKLCKKFRPCQSFPFLFASLLLKSASVQLCQPSLVPLFLPSECSSCGNEVAFDGRCSALRFSMDSGGVEETLRCVGRWSALHVAMKWLSMADAVLCVFRWTAVACWRYNEAMTIRSRAYGHRRVFHRPSLCPSFIMHPLMQGEQSVLHEFQHCLTGGRAMARIGVRGQLIGATRRYPLPCTLLISTLGSSFRCLRNLVMYTSILRALK